MVPTPSPFRTRRLFAGALLLLFTTALASGARASEPVGGPLGITVDKTTYTRGETQTISLRMNAALLPQMLVDAHVAVVYPDNAVGILAQVERFEPFTFGETPLWTLQFDASDPTGDYVWYFVLVPAGTNVYDIDNWLAYDSALFTLTSGSDPTDPTDPGDGGGTGDGGQTSEPDPGDGGQTQTPPSGEVTTGGSITTRIDGNDAVLDWPDAGYNYSRLTVTQGAQTVRLTVGNVSDWVVGASDAALFASFTPMTAATVGVELAQGADPAAGAGQIADVYSAVTLDAPVPDTYSVGGVQTITGSVPSDVGTVIASVFDSSGTSQYRFDTQAESGRFSLRLRFPAGSEGSYFLGFMTDQQRHTTGRSITVVSAPTLTWKTTDLQKTITPAHRREITGSASDITVNGFTSSLSTGASVTLTGTAHAAMRAGAPFEKPDGTVETLLFDGYTGAYETVPGGTSFSLDASFPTAGVYKIEINLTSGLAAFNRPVYVGGVLPLIDYEAWYLASRNATKTPVTQMTLSQMRTEWLRLINADRTAAGLGEVTLNTTLNSVAQGHADDMAANNYFSHTNLSGEGPQERASAQGWTSGVGENISLHQSIVGMEIGLLESGGHRANILNSKWTVVGLGIAVDASGNGYGVQNFSAP